MDPLNDLRRDRTSGASRLALESLKTFIALAREGGVRDEEGERERLCALVSSIIEAQPSMASVFSSMACLFPLEGRTASGVRLAAIGKARRLLARLPLFEERISVYGARLIGEGQTVFTLSSSSSVVSVLKKASSKGISAIICESSPGKESRSCARTLSMIISTTLIPDFCLSHFMPEADLVLVGADSVCPTHLTNKCGTRLVVREARAHGIPVTCACDTTKMLPFMLPILEKRRTVGRLTRGKVLFDRTPLADIDAFVTERGVLTRSDVVRMAKAKGKALASIPSFSGVGRDSHPPQSRRPPPRAPRPQRI